VVKAGRFYGRYWGAFKTVKNLHFEACCELFEWVRLCRCWHALPVPFARFCVDCGVLAGLCFLRAFPPNPLPPPPFSLNFVGVCVFRPPARHTHIFCVYWPVWHLIAAALLLLLLLLPLLLLLLLLPLLLRGYPPGSISVFCCSAAAVVALPPPRSSCPRGDRPHRLQGDRGGIFYGRRI